MSPAVKLKLFKSRIAEQFQFFLRLDRCEIDIVIVYSTAAAVFFVLLRLQMLEKIVFVNEWEGNHHLRALWAILREDMYYLAALTILCLLICSHPISSTRLRAGATIVYCIIVFIGLMFLNVNVELAPMYGTQLDYSLLKLAGLIAGTTTTIIAVTPSSFFFDSALVCVGLLLAPSIAMSNFYQTRRVRIRRSFCTIGICGIIAITAVSGMTIGGLVDLNSRETRNSLAYFLTSLVTEPHLPSFDLDIREPGTATSDNTIFLPHVNRPILAGSLDNVLVIVLESVGAEYFELLKDHGLLPTFSSIMSRSVYFDNSYVSAPSTAISLVTMLTSTGPLASYKIVTSDYPRAKLTTSYEQFKHKGFVTGFFWSADSQYLNMNNFLRDRGIDLVQDYRQRNCPQSRNLVNSSSSTSYIFSADICTASSLLNWIDDNRGKPFFASLWTEQTHYLYAASSSCMNAVAEKNGSLQPYIERFDENWPRYAAALCDADQMMATILSGLRERKLLENTLLVIVGDHGESFGQHNAFAHGSEIFEEDVRDSATDFSRPLSGRKN